VRGQKLLGARVAPAAAIALGVALSLPSLNTGLSADDWIQKAFAVGPTMAGLERRPLDYFSFADGVVAHAQALVDHGVYPWWTDVHVRLAFFRPLAALTHALDWRLFPSRPWLMHLHNLVWLALALAAVGFVYRRLLRPPWLATLALLLYATDQVHGAAIGWIANRNAMVTLALGLPAIALHDRQRRENWAPGGWLAPLALLAGLCAGEAAIGVVAYLVAYALTLEEGPLVPRLLRLWPYALVVAGWQVVYHRLGYGAARSGVYLDPAGDSAAFLRALPGRGAALLVGQFALPWSDFTPLWRILSARLDLEMTLYSFAVVAIVACLVWPTLQRHAVARFFAVGLLLATVPVCATFPADRLLWFVGVGAMGLLACFFADEPRGLRRVGAWAMIALHIFLAPPLLALRSRSMTTVEKPLSRANDTIPKTPDITHKTVVLMNPPAEYFAGYVQLTRAGKGEPQPARLRWLATGADGVELTREDANTLRVRQVHGFTHNISEIMLRSPRDPLAAGQHIAIAGLAIDILAPDEARMRFDVPLEDASLVWLRWQDERGYVPATPPPVGATLALPPVNLLAATFPRR
jgi:hypothetical protein